MNTDICKDTDTTEIHGLPPQTKSTEAQKIVLKKPLSVIDDFRKLSCIVTAYELH